MHETDLGTTQDLGHIYARHKHQLMIPTRMRIILHKSCVGETAPLSF